MLTLCTFASFVSAVQIKKKNPLARSLSWKQYQGKRRFYLKRSGKTEFTRMMSIQKLCQETVF